jgi:hypothetical protein
MKYTRRLFIALLIFSIGILSTAIWSAHLGKRIWSPRVFAWRNPLRQAPQIDLQPDSPLVISNSRYYSFMSIGSAVGGVLRFDITNRSDKPIHSYDCRYYSPVPVGNGSYGSHPEEGLSPGSSREDSISAHEYAPLTLTIDFAQFADGTTWFSHSPQATVKPAGVTTGAEAAVSHLLGLLDQNGVEAVMEALPRIHADVKEPYDAASHPEFGIFGFYCGVTNAAVRVEHEYKDGGAARVESFLRSYQT